MTATVIPLSSARDQTARPVVTITLPPKVYARLLKLADKWDLTADVAAQDLLLTAINKAAGLGMLK